MRNLFRILKRYLYIILFLVLELIALIFFFKKNSYQQSRLFSKTLEIRGFCTSVSNSLSRTFYAASDIEALQSENSELRKLLESSRLESIEAKEVSISKAESRQVYTYIPAIVTYRSSELNENKLIINIGRNAGIEEGMAVISPRGVVGMVEAVSSNFALVMSVINTKSNLSVSLHSGAYTASLVWQGGKSNEAIVEGLPSHLVANIGDFVETSGYSVAFPSGIKVGTVVEVLPSNDSFKKLKIRLNEDFRNLSSVYVINNLYKAELDSLFN